MCSETSGSARFGSESPFRLIPLPLGIITLRPTLRYGSAMRRQEEGTSPRRPNPRYPIAACIAGTFLSRIPVPVIPCPADPDRSVPPTTGREKPAYRRMGGTW